MAMAKCRSEARQLGCDYGGGLAMASPDVRGSTEACGIQFLVKNLKLIAKEESVPDVELGSLCGMGWGAESGCSWQSRKVEMCNKVAGDWCIDE